MATSKSTLPPKTPGEENDPFNRADLQAQEKLEGTWSVGDEDQFYKHADDEAAAKEAEKVREAEENPELPNDRDGLYRPTGKDKPRRIQAKALIRKRGPMFALFSLIIGAGLGFSAFFSPSLLIIHMKEIMTEKFHTSLASTEARSVKLLNAKIDDGTDGLCGAVVTLKCRFSTMSPDQVTNFKNAGITVVPEKPNAGKRTKPTAYIFKGQTITAANFAELSRSDSDFKTALRRAYNPKYGGFQGKPWTGTATKYKINKTKTNIPGETDEERMKSLNDEVRNGSTGGTPRTLLSFEEECKTTGCNAQEEYDKYRTQLDAIDADGKSGAAGNVASEYLSSGNLAGKALFDGLKITGLVDNACQAYGAVNMLGYLAKTIRAIQLARYAMVFLKAADEIKSGEGMTPETASFLGATLTEVTYDLKSTTNRIKRGAATDSLGYKFAAFGDTSAGTNSSNNLASRYLAGGGLTGELIEFTDTVVSFIPGGRASAQSVCGTLANPVVQVGSAVVGIAALLVPGANVAKIAAQAAGGILLSAGLALIPTLLADIVAGTVTDGAQGEESGNIIASGSGGMLSDTLAGLSGNASMTKEDTLAYLNLHDQVIADYAEETRLTSSPFDPTTRHTFLGGIVATIIPSLNTSSQGTGYLSTLGSLLSSSLSSIIPKTNALTTEQQRAALEVCKDEQAIAAGYATDIFCNVIRGIPPKYLDKDPQLVIDELKDAGEMYENDALSVEHAKFVQQCIESKNPPGYDDAGNFDEAKAEECIIDDENANRYLLYADKRIEEVLGGEPIEEPEPPVATGGSGVTGDVVPPVDPGYTISSPFNDPNYSGTPPHKGTDISGYAGGSLGKPVYAIAAGTVIASGIGQGCSGNNIVQIRLGGGEIAGYYHMNGGTITVRVGDTVTPGQLIGKIASCGDSTGAHLHFEMSPGSNTEGWVAALPRVQKYGNTYLDPVAYLAHYGVKL